MHLIVGVNVILRGDFDQRFPPLVYEKLPIEVGDSERHLRLMINEDHRTIVLGDKPIVGAQQDVCHDPFSFQRVSH
jgi:hypothetical protein